MASVSNERRLALFDFDGTITKSDSMFRFVRFTVGDLRFALGMLVLSPMFLLLKLKVISNSKAKQWMMQYFFAGLDERSFNRAATEYSLSHIDKILRPQAIEKIEWHKAQGHTVVLVSASMESWLKPWCDQNGLRLISTQLEFINGVISGRLVGKNCHGIEKVKRVKKQYDLSQYAYIYAYGDSRGDKELLALADESYYKPFR